MRHRFGIWSPAILAGALFTLAIGLAPITRPASGEPGPRAWSGPDSLRRDSSLTEPPQAWQLIQPAALALALADTTATRPAVLQIGFKVLWRSGHIPGTRFIGPTSKPDGMAALQQALRKLPRQQAVVLYCGCCPWADCPNVRPAYRVARELGFKDVRVLDIAKNLQHDWIDKGLPIVDGE